MSKINKHIENDIRLEKEYHEDIEKALDEYNKIRYEKYSKEPDNDKQFGYIKIANDKNRYYFIHEENGCEHTWDTVTKYFNSKINFIYNVNEIHEVKYFNIFTKEEVIETIINKKILTGSILGNITLYAKSERNNKSLKDLLDIYKPLIILVYEEIEEVLNKIKKSIFKIIDLDKFKLELLNYSAKELLEMINVDIYNRDSLIEINNHLVIKIDMICLQSIGKYLKDNKLIVHSFLGD